VEDCLSGDQEGWRRLVTHFNSVIQVAVIRTLRQCGQLTNQLADDLVQETYMRLCANRCKVLRDFRQSESVGLYGLLQSVAISVAFDHIRAAVTLKRGAGRSHVPIETEAGVSVPDPDGHRMAEKQVLFREIDQYLRDIVPVETAERDRRIFWLYYRQGLTAKDIASLPGMGLSPEGVESTLHRLTSKLKKLVHGFGEAEK